MSMKLRDLIRAVRACKTAAEERAVITKESALIRSSFKDEVTEYKHRNVAKLLYIWLLGYPTHFGYMECIKLLASSQFAEKRIGYLALTLLLDEKTEVLTLVTNSISKDLATGPSSVVGCALTAIGNLASTEMAHDLAGQVNEKLKDKSEYVKKKAALAVIRMIKKAPELIDMFLPNIVVMLTDKSFAVLLTAITLVTAVVEIQPSYIDKFTRLVPALVKILRKLLTAGYLPQYDVGGVADPFLQCKVLTLCRILGHGNSGSSDLLSSTLAQVATNTDGQKNAGNAVLYEAVNTIMAVEAESGLRVLAVNILGKFLGSKDPNLKYVALETLTKVVHLDVAAVQRHRKVVVECLRDGDVSIRKRALDLIYALVNSDNILPLTKELLNYLHAADDDTKPDLCVKIAAVADKYAPNKRWHIDVLISMLASAGNFAKKVAVSQTLFLISHNPADHASFTHKLFAMAWHALHSTTEAQQALLQIAVWVVGEYGDILLSPPPAVADAEQLAPPHGETRTEAEILKMLDKVLHTYYVTPETKAMVLTALLKLTVRLKDAGVAAKARSILAAYENAADLELQARSVEFTYIADPSKVPSLAPHRAGLLAPMPLLEEAVLRSRVGAATGAATDAAALGGEDVAMIVQERSRDGAAPTASGAGADTADLLGDLSDLLGTGLIMTSTSAPSSKAPAPAPAPSKKAALDLDALFSTVSSTAGDFTPVPHAAAQTLPSSTSSALDGLDDLLGVGSITKPSTSAATSVSALDAVFHGLPTSPAASPAPAANQVTAFAPAPAPISVPSTASAADDDFGEPVSAALPLPHTFVAYEGPHVRVTLKCEKPDGFNTPATDILATFSATGAGVKNFVCQVAPPRFLKLNLLPASGTTLGPSGSSPVTQMIKVDNSQHGVKAIMLKLRLTYNVDGTADQIVESPEIKSFPVTL